MTWKYNPFTDEIDFWGGVDVLSSLRHTLNAGENLTINDYEQKLVHSIFTINSTAIVTIDGSGELVVIGAI
jgi:hypothetical protein